MPSNPGELVRRLPRLGSLSVAVPENLDVPEKHQTSLGWLGPTWSQLQNVSLAHLGVFWAIVPNNPGELVRRLPRLDSLSVAVPENLDVPEKHQTRLGWLGPSSKM